MRLRTSIGLAVCVGCGGTISSTLDGGSVSDGGALNDAVAVNDVGVQSSNSVHGTVVQVDGTQWTDGFYQTAGVVDLHIPIANRGVSVLDANGVVQTTTTDASGAFTVDNVAAPYSIAIQGTAPKPLDVAYIDVHTYTPKLFGANPTRGEHHAPITVHITPPDCGSGVPSCYYTAVATSDGGFPAGMAGTSIIDFDWSGPGTTNVLISGLVHNAALDYWFGQQTVAVTDNSPTTASFDVAAVPNETVTLSIGDLTWFGSLGVVLPQGGMLGGGQTPSVVPIIPGASLSIFGGNNHMTSTDPSFGVFDNDVPLSTTSSTLTLHTASPTWVSPTVATPTIATNGVLSFQPASSAGDELEEFQLLIPGHGGVLIVTKQTQVALADLAKLGIAISPGTYFAELSAQGPITDFDATLESGSLNPILAGIAPGNWWTAQLYINAVTVTP